MSKQCVFCQKEFEYAPPEHVIPKSIGGQYTIHSPATSTKNLNKALRYNEVLKNHRFSTTFFEKIVV